MKPSIIDNKDGTWTIRSKQNHVPLPNCYCCGAQLKTDLTCPRCGLCHTLVVSVVALSGGGGSKTNEQTKCPTCGCQESKAIEKTHVPNVDVSCIKCGTLYDHIVDATKRPTKLSSNEPAAKGCADGLNNPTLEALSTIADMFGFEMQEL